MLAADHRETERVPQNQVLTPETRKGRDPAQRQRRQQVTDRRDGHLLRQPTVLAQRLLVVHRVDHRARPQEEARLEEGVRGQVEQTRHISPDSQGHDHIPQLTHRRVGQYLLDVVLNQGNGGCKDRRDPPRIGDEQKGSLIENRQHAPDQVHPGGHHRGGVDQGADRRGAFHRVGQPDVQRELRALAHGAQKNSHPGKGLPVTRQRAIGHRRENIRILQRSDLRVTDH